MRLPVWTWYDKHNRELRKDYYRLNNEVYIDTKYLNGRLYRVSEPHYNDDSQIVWALTNKYDAYNRLSIVETPLGNTEYDYSGVRTVTVKAPNSTKVTVLNEDGNVKSTSINGKSVQYNDWPTGEVYTATPEGGSAVETHFDMKGNRILLNDPDAGLISTTYNGFGDVLSQENRGRNDEEIINTIYSYDEETGLVDYVTENGIVTDYGYDEEFRLETISIDDLHSKTYEYGSFKRVTKIAENIEGNKSFTESIIYDDYNRVVKNIYPFGYSISYNYNKHSELFSVSDKDKYTIWTAKESNANGQYTKTLKGGLECTYNYNNRSLPELISADGIVNMTYVFDKDVRLESRTDHISNNAEEFSYDTKGRLQSWTVKRTNEDPILNSIIYDTTTGNIKSKSDIQYIMNYGENDFGPHAITSINGKPASFSDEEQFIEYTSFKKVSKITEGSNELNIVYGIDKQRRKSVFSGGLTRYYFNNYEEDYSGNNVKKVHYITGGNGITAMYIETNGVGQLYHLITDYQGSLIAITNKDGEIASFDGSEQKIAYDPWGNQRNPNDWKLIDTRTKWLFDRGYTMHEHLDGFTLINMNGRVYDPMLAQFLSPDPYIQSPDNWLNYNRYTYCLNNPMLYTDPSGEFWHLVIGAVIGGTLNAIMNADEIGSFGEGLGYFGIGAVAGAVGAGVGSGMMAAQAGSSFGAGFIGTQSAMTAISTSYTTSFLSGAAIGGLSSFSSSFISGAGNAWMGGDNFGEGLWNGFQKGVVSGIQEAAIGGLLGGLDATGDNRKFWNGDRKYNESGRLIPRSGSLIENGKEEIYELREWLESEPASGVAAENGYIIDVDPESVEFLDVKIYRDRGWIQHDVNIRYNEVWYGLGNNKDFSCMQEFVNKGFAPYRVRSFKHLFGLYIKTFY